jgi:DnaJ-class molecular chaperone
MSETDMSPFEPREICCPDCDGRGYSEVYGTDDFGPTVHQDVCTLCKGVGMYSSRMLEELEERAQ